MKKNNTYRIRSIKYNLLMNIILKVSLIIFPLISFPYVSRILRVEGIGRITTANSIINNFVLFASLGIPTYGIKACAELRDKKEKLNKTTSEILFINILTLILTYLVFTIMLIVLSGYYSDKELLLVLSLNIPLTAMGVEWFYRAIEQYDYITIRNIIVKSVSILLMFILVKKSEDLIIYAFLFVLGSTGSYIFNMMRLHKYVSIDFHNLEIKRHLIPIITLFLYSAATSIYTNLDNVFLSALSGNYQVGLYSVSTRVRSVLVGFVTALGSVLLPRLSYYVSNKKETEFNDLIRKSISFVLLLSLPLAMYFIIESDNVVLLLGGNEYIESTSSMKIVMISLVLIGLSSITSWQILLPLGKNNVVLFGAIAGAIIDVLLNIVLIPGYGAVGASIAMCVAELTVLCTHCFAIPDVIFKNIDIKNITKIIMGCAISCILLFVLPISIKNNIFRLIITSMFFGIIYLSMLIILKENVLSSYFKRMLKLIKDYFNDVR